MKKHYALLLLIFAFTFCKAQIVNIPDANFKAKLLAASPTASIAYNISFAKIKIDTNNDGEIQVAEAQQVFWLYVDNANISNLTGINSFTGLNTLKCTGNQLTSLDILGLTDLRYLYADNNAITTISTTGMTALRVLSCNYNMLTSLNVSALINLERLECEHNLISNLVLSSSMYSLKCGYNLLTQSNFQSVNLNVLSCHHNQLTSINLSNMTNLAGLDCSYNNLSTLNVSLINAPSTIFQLNCSFNPNLTYLNTKDGKIITSDFYIYKIASNSTAIPPPLESAIKFEGTPNLQYFCADAGELAFLQSKINTPGYTNPTCQLSSTCEFLNPTSSTTTATACDSYTWTVNNQTYTTSGTYTVVTGNHTEILNLTITPSTTTTTTITACGPYEWPVTTQTYTTSGSYSVIDGCHTETLLLTISTPAISSHPVNACSALNTTTVFSVSSTMPTPVYTWQYSVISASNPNPTWIDITSANAGTVYANYTTSSLSVTRSATLPVNGTAYRAIIEGACGSLTSNAASILFTAPAVAGTISVPASVCTGGTITFTLSGSSGTAVQWQSASSATGTFTNISGATGTSYTIVNATSTINKSYRAVVTNSCSNTTATTAIKTIKVDVPSVAGTITGGGIVCLGSTGALKVTGYKGSIQWQYSTDGVNYTNAPKATDSQVGLPFTTTSTSSMGVLYSLTNINAAVYFRAKITSGVCSVVYTNQVQYTIGTLAIAGTISPATSYVCTGSGTTLTLTGFQGAVTWQKSINWYTASPTWSNVTNTTVSSFYTQNLSYNTAYRVKVTIGACSTVYSAIAIVYLYPKPLAKSIKANVTSPSGSAATVPLCTDLSIPKTYTIGAGYVGTIQWERSSTSTTAGFTEIAGATGETYTVTNPVVGANYFRVRLTNVCGATAYSGAGTLYYTNCTPLKTVAKTPFDVVVYPNPTEAIFRFNVITSNEEKMQIAVYDMTGKLVERREGSPSEIADSAIGSHYASGIYNIVVTQGTDLKAIRVIKK